MHVSILPCKYAKHCSNMNLDMVKAMVKGVGTPYDTERLTLYSELNRLCHACAACVWAYTDCLSMPIMSLLRLSSS